MNINNVSVHCCDFKTAIKNHPDDFLFLDPPYYLGTDSKMFKGMYPNCNFAIHHNDFEFKQWLDKYKYNDRHPENTLEFYRDKCAKTLTDYENSLGENLYLLGSKIQLVDIAIFPFVRQCANVDRPWFGSTFPYVEQWVDNWIQSELFVRVMPKFDAWKLDNDPLYISF